MRFKPGFKPDRMWATDAQLKGLGMTVHSPRSEGSYMWTHEQPIDIDIPDIGYDATATEMRPGDCAVDVVFRNGVIFGYVDPKDIIDA